MVAAGFLVVSMTVACTATAGRVGVRKNAESSGDAGDRTDGSADGSADGGADGSADGTADGGAGSGAVADGHRVNVLTYNVCATDNRDRTCTRDLTRARRKVWASRVAGLIRSRKVDAASFTEMCYAQVSLLKRELPDYRFVWYGIARGGGDKCRLLWGDLTRKTTPPDGKRFGMALALKGRIHGSPLRRMLKVDRPPADRSAKIHPRGLLCARTVMGKRRSVSCVTHISDTESPRQVVDLVERYAGGRPVILSGDFNRLPDDRQLAAVYGLGLGGGDYTEVDAAPYGRADGGAAPTTRGGRKIDYIFASENDYRAMGAQVIRTRPELSDHRPLLGTLVMKPRVP
ncbi:hypothetical protein Mth01_31250 [Sphaerimonospora thailandensis]|uniref:Endonuclease/exonuclease/phosphatase domain-containing protein n=1 Tax=Sphaerimonospora thailandensis TaxID=795644 RepID=A0A8J3RBM3_9ACTN|nr:hypothetical protein Mth01_31250 [Sphaerimonospora thailandensis]